MTPQELIAITGQHQLLEGGELTSEEKCNAWEYNNGKWTAMPDPCDVFIDECNGDCDAGIKRAGYTSSELIGDEYATFSTQIYTRRHQKEDANIPLKYPYLVCINDTADTVVPVYCPSFPDCLSLVNLCMPGMIGSYFTETFSTYEGALRVALRPYEKQHEREEQELARMRKRNKGAG